MTDDQCVQFIARGDEEPFQILFQRYGHLVLGTCCRYLGDRVTAEDASQEVWVRVVQSAKSFQAQGKCRGWILQITRNICLTLIRKRGFEIVVDGASVEEVEQPEAELLTQLARAEDQQFIKKMIDELPASQRVALVMRLSEDASYAAIGKALATTESAVKSLIFRARQTLISQWEARNG